jgi:diguanylate cyclase (GGDEF)-like protein
MIGKKNNNPIVGVVVDRLESGYFRGIFTGIEDCAKRHRINIILFNGRMIESPFGYEYQNNVIYDHITSKNVDAVVMMTDTLGNQSGYEHFEAFYQKFSPLPLVSVGSAIQGIPSIYVGNKNGMKEAVLHLIDDHKIKRIAFLSGPLKNIEARDRLAGYRDALAERGIHADEKLIVEGDFTVPGGSAAIDTLLNVRKVTFDAVVAANDEMVTGAIDRLNTQGINVPLDCACVGFDNADDTRFFIPPLTSVDQSLFDMGYCAIDYAKKLVHGEEVPERTELPTRLVIRSSCGCIMRPVMDFNVVATDRNFKQNAEDIYRTRDRIVERCAEWMPGKGSPAEMVRFVPLIEQLFDIIDYHENNPGELTERFLSILSQILNGEVRNRNSISAWQGILTVLYGCFIPKDKGNNLEIYNAVFQKARIILAEMMRYEQAGLEMRSRADLLGFRDMTKWFSEVAQIDELVGFLNSVMIYLDIKSCYVVKYDKAIRNKKGDDWTMPVVGELLMAYNDGLIVVSDAERNFALKEGLVPQLYLPHDRPCNLVVNALYYRDEQIGYIVFELGSRDYLFYEAFCSQLGSVLRHILPIAPLEYSDRMKQRSMFDATRIADISHIDKLTGFYSRKAFHDLACQHFDLARGMGKRGLVIAAGIDGIDAVDSTYGAGEVEEVLRAAAEVIRRCFRQIDIIARVGNDAFIVFTVDTDEDFLEKLRARLERYVEESEGLGGKPYRLDFRIGVAAFSNDSTHSLDALITEATKSLEKSFN